MTGKRDALATLVTTTLQAKDATFQVDKRIREATFKSVKPVVRASVMGNPIRYATVSHRSQPPMRLPNATGIQTNPLEETDEFEVQIWYEYADSDVEDDASETGFNEALFDADGLLPTLRSTPWLDSAAAALGNPVGYVSTLVEMEGEGHTICHYAAFRIQIT